MIQNRDPLHALANIAPNGADTLAQNVRDADAVVTILAIPVLNAEESIISGLTSPTSCTTVLFRLG